jgi:transcriptional regulator with XRE-family HTH domain
MNLSWQGEVVGTLHNHKIQHKEFAARLGLNEKYVSQILNGHENPKSAEEKFRTALAEMIAERTDEC